ncbi:hypothetical protein COU56_04725 [Candidatus Pacearchaeota archaeon CG10_big_fil_rev_8_21_14_0_10_31_9]|nr:MAG: hypothetical protein AUJ62_00705 [Candidatus Pacearchaeota archaeon CG1_02_32_21]PIN91774.1 MAG: hypothetical protein COU56_04725 [Candidatus Pacearchaeota archaeon CG10_big_fil_rev_8_21_14_0_10_31_9]PIZ82779.1 MAG: hypothetical protein COX97_03030 [Candidatus Pacearchaeota archaeon CG_4_10_14_0_2_um_filter_05_32_18]
MARTKHLIKITKPYSLRPSSINFKGRFRHEEVVALRRSLVNYVLCDSRINIDFNPAATGSTKHARVEAVVSDSDHFYGILDRIRDSGYKIVSYTSEEEN